MLTSGHLRLRGHYNHAIRLVVKRFMPTHQEQYDDAMFDFSTGDYASAIAKFKAVLGEDPAHFDAQLALGMAYYRQGDYAAAIVEGHKAEKLRPGEQLVHTNLSLFYMKAGDKKTAEHHGLQARIASWKGNMAVPDRSASDDPELKMAQPVGQDNKLPTRFPDMPWKKKPPAGGGTAPARE
jgi:Flp pilus assembly protein TadD